MTSMIARTRTPERWAGVFFTVSTTSQLALAFAFARWVLPLFGAFVVLLVLGLYRSWRALVAVLVSLGVAVLLGVAWLLERERETEQSMLAKVGALLVSAGAVVLAFAVNSACLAEVPASTDAVRLMKYYRALWLTYQGLL